MTIGTISAQTFDIYIGSYTQNSTSRGIYHAVLDSSTGTLSEPELAAETPNPTFLAFRSDGAFLYATVQEKSGRVRVFAVQPDKKLHFLKEVPSGGEGPCHISLTGGGGVLLAANYGSGNVTSIAVNADGLPSDTPGSLIQHIGHGPNPRRQEAPHPHSINVSPDGKHIYVADLGLDKLLIYTLDIKTACLRPNNPAEAILKPASGPRHIKFRPDGKVVYVVSELDSTITVLARNPQSGALTIIQNISTFPADFKGDTWSAEVCLHPNGRFLYVSNRGHDSIAVFAVDAVTGSLKLSSLQNGHVKFPHHFNIDPTGHYCLVANRNADNLTLFKINQDSGSLEFTGRVINVAKPSYVGFLQ